MGAATPPDPLRHHDRQRLDGLFLPRRSTYRLNAFEGLPMGDYFRGKATALTQPASASPLIHLDLALVLGRASGSTWWLWGSACNEQAGQHGGNGVAHVGVSLVRSSRAVHAADAADQAGARQPRQSPTPDNGQTLLGLKDRQVPSIHTRDSNAPLLPRPQARSPAQAGSFALWACAWVIAR
jgi:hypothetical protein